ncbi:MAG: hypothetical protein ACI4DU_00415 [Lachnospiraceae bacterium]
MQGANLANNISELAQIVLTEEDRQRLAAGESVKIWLEATEGHPTVEEQTLTENLLQTVLPEYNLGTFLDFRLWKQFSTGQPTIIYNTSGNVTVKFHVPEPLINTDASVVRTYQMIRVHNGVTDVLPCSYDATAHMVSFETDRFSSYALVYTDVAQNNPNVSVNPLDGANPSGDENTTTSDGGQLDDVPKTGVISNTPIWLSLMVISGVGIVFAKKRSIKKH